MFGKVCQNMNTVSDVVNMGWTKSCEYKFPYRIWNIPEGLRVSTLVGPAGGHLFGNFNQEISLFSLSSNRRLSVIRLRTKLWRRRENPGWREIRNLRPPGHCRQRISHCLVNLQQNVIFVHFHAVMNWYSVTIFSADATLNTIKSKEYLILGLGIPTELSFMINPLVTLVSGAWAAAEQMQREGERGEWNCANANQSLKRERQKRRNGGIGGGEQEMDGDCGQWG